MNKRKLKSKIIRTSIFIIALLSVTISVAYGWYSGNTYIRATNNNIMISVSNDVRISKDGINWEYSIGPEESQARLIPITTNCYNFFRSVYSISEPDEDGVEKIEFDSFEIMTMEDVESSAIVKEFSISTLFKVGLYIDEESYVKPAVELTEEELAEGQISGDYIAGAVRVVVQIKNEEGWETIAYWIPNTTYELSTDVDGKYHLTTNGDYETKIKYMNEELEETYLSVNTENGAIVQNNLKLIYGDIPHDNYVGYYKLTTLNAGVTDFRMIIYVDGFDREISPALARGFIDVLIKFHTEIE